MLTMASWVGAGTPFLRLARTTLPLMVSTSVLLPWERSAQMDVTPSGDISLT